MEKSHTVKSKLIDNIPIIFLGGDITSEADTDIINSYNKLKDSNSSYNLIIDFTDTKYINSAGIATLINIIQDFNDCGGSVKFTGLNAHFRKVMEIVGINDFVEIYNTYEEAIKNLSK